MPKELHCPQCLTRISPYEGHTDPKTGVNCCWQCGLPMSEVLSKLGITEMPDLRSEHEKEVAELRAELARLRAVEPPAAPEPARGEPLAVAEPAKDFASARPAMTEETHKAIYGAKPHASEAETPAPHRGPGRPPARK